MKIFAGLALFFLTFALGTQSAQQISASIEPSNLPSLPVVEEHAQFEMERSMMPDGIAVSYVGMQGEDENGGSFQRLGSHLKFIVHNGTDNVISYSSNGGPYGAFPEILIDGKKQPEGYRCGSGARVYSIEPHMSAEIRLHETEFEVVPKKNAQISVGFYIRNPISKSKLQPEIYSEPFILPEPFRNSIGEWRREVDARWTETGAK